MMRSVMLVLVGAVAGGVAVCAVSDPRGWALLRLSAPAPGAIEASDVAVSSDSPVDPRTGRRRRDGPADGSVIVDAPLPAGANQSVAAEPGANRPVGNRLSFEVEAIAELAATDPLSALHAVEARDSAVVTRLALPRIAAEAVRLDPEAGIADAQTLENFEVRLSYTRFLLEAWAESDPDGVFDWIETADALTLPDLGGPYGLLAAANPERLLAATGRLPGSVRHSAFTDAIAALAEADLARAMAVYAAMPPGHDTDGAAAEIAAVFARQNPEAALAWARTLRGETGNGAASRVLREIAATDVDRASVLVLAEIDRGSRSPAGNAIFSVSDLMALADTPGGDFAAIAERVLESGAPSAVAVVTSAIDAWTRTDIDAALDWTSANADRLNGDGLGRLARRLVARDAARTIALLERLPPEQRGDWLEGLAGGLASIDVEQALGVVERHRGQPGFDAAFTNLSGAIARTDPERAAGMLASVPASERTVNATVGVARTWAGQDPAVAAAWAAGLSDARGRTEALGAVAETWARADPGTARQWLLGFERGPVRDVLLDRLSWSMAQTGRFDAALLDAYSDTGAAQWSASRAIVRIGSDDPDTARRLLDRYVTDAEIRRRADAYFVQSAGSGRAVQIPSDLPER
jgi:hypothetical protein